MKRRAILRGAASLVGLFGAFLGAIPFLNYLLPSAKAKALAGPIEVDLSVLRPGEVRAYSYRGRTMLVLRRTDEMIDTLSSMQDRLIDRDTTRDPGYVANSHRSITPEFLVVEGICTHLACVPQLKTAAEGKSVVGNWWAGGLICPCHISGYDYAGRVVRGPAPRNLPIPPHRYLSPTRLVIGEGSAPS